MHPKFVKKNTPFLLSITLSISLSILICLPLLAQGCRSSIFSQAGQANLIQFQFNCAALYLTVLFFRTVLITWFFQKSGFAKIALRSLLGTVISFSALFFGSYYVLVSLITSFQNPVVAAGLFSICVALWVTLCDYFFALDRQKSKIKQIFLVLLVNLLFNCSAIVAIYLSFFANANSFFLLIY